LAGLIMHNQHLLEYARRNFPDDPDTSERICGL
jgi:hypothetical protein